MLDSLVRDLTFAVRSLRRAPAFTAIALLTLALGIGANTAIFSVVNGVLLSPLRLGDPDRLVAVNEVPRSATTVSLTATVTVTDPGSRCETRTGLINA